MAQFRIFDQPIYSYYKRLIDFNISERENINDCELNSAINLNIILNCACYIEGFLEDCGKLMLGYYREVINSVKYPELELRKPKNTFYNNVEEFLSKKISQTTGIDNYNLLFEMLTGKSFKKDDNIKPVLEAINVLYQFRNVIAHGRQIHLYEVKAYYTDGFEEQYSGGYKKAEEYLIKNNLISTKIKDALCPHIYFTNEIADHFYQVTKLFVEAFNNFIHSNLIIGNKLLSNLEKYNKKHGKDISIEDYLKRRSAIPY